MKEFMSDNVEKFKNIELCQESSGQNKKNGSEEKRTGSDRRKFSFGYPGSERRKGKDRRKKEDLN
jgi:hypothetical protein